MNIVKTPLQVLDGQAAFNQLVAEHPFVVVEFTAEWCAPCQQFAPVLTAAASEHPGVVFASADVDVAIDLAANFQVRQVPALMVVRERVVIDMVTGAMQAHELAHHLHMWSALDLAPVAAHFAQRPEAASA